MTLRQNSIKDADEQWADELMAAERRRLRTVGTVLLVGAAVLTAVILYYFGSLAATGW